MKRFKTTAILAAGLLFLTLASCKKEDTNNYIPYVTVDLVININNPSNFHLQPVGGWGYFSGGSRGIVVYHLSQDEFMAYDRHSPYQPENGCQVNVDSTSFSLIDPCSGSKFSLVNGGVEQGPATLPLKQYRTSFDGTYLRVTN